MREEFNNSAEQTDSRNQGKTSNIVWATATAVVLSLSSVEPDHNMNFINTAQAGSYEMLETPQQFDSLENLMSALVTAKELWDEEKLHDPDVHKRIE